MRIGLDATSAVRQGAGIGRYVRELLRALARRNTEHTFRLFAASTLPFPHPLPPLPRSFTLRRLPFHDLWLARLWHRARLPLPVELLLGPLDLFHAPDFTLPPTLPGLPTLLTVHDLSFVRDPASASPGLLDYLNAVVPRSVRRATHVLADSAATRADLLELYGTPPEKVEVLYPGVDASFRRASSADQLRVRQQYQLGDVPFLLALGTLQPRKNYARLIRAFARLPHSGLRLVIVGGKGWMFGEILAEVKRLGLTDRVLFPGFVADADLPALYSAAEVFAYPSLYEGFGLPVLEAMACGTPVVTSTASCLPEVAGDAAHLVDPLDVDALAAALDHLVTDSELRARLIPAGIAQAAKFNWDEAAKQLVGIYEGMAL